MKKYLLLAIICASLPSSILAGCVSQAGCTGATAAANNYTSAASLTGSNTGSFTGSCCLEGPTAQSPVIISAILNSNNTVTLSWNWHDDASHLTAIFVEYSTDLGVTWKIAGKTTISTIEAKNSYTTGVLAPGNYIFKVGYTANYNDTSAYFSPSSSPITINTSQNFITIAPVPQLYVGTQQQISGTFKFNAFSYLQSNLAIVLLIYDTTINLKQVKIAQFAYPKTDGYLEMFPTTTTIGTNIVLAPQGIYSCSFTPKNEASKITLTAKLFYYFGYDTASELSSINLLSSILAEKPFGGCKLF